MGAQQSKDEQLYHQVKFGNVEGIKVLYRAGAGLEWVDRYGRTPLILACMRSDLFPVVKLLIELGANVNASSHPGRRAGTPLHHAAKRGLIKTVDLLLSHGANPLSLNGKRQTALDLARAKGHYEVVRSIENSICLFSGWLRELHWPRVLEAFVGQWASRKTWAVVLPCHTNNTLASSKFHLALYTELKVAKPRAIVELWRCHFFVPDFNQTDPTVAMEDMPRRKRYKFSSAQEGDKQQIQHFYNVCRGIMPQCEGNVSASNTHQSQSHMPTPVAPVQVARPTAATPVQDTPPSPLPSAPPIIGEAFYNDSIQYASINSSTARVAILSLEAEIGKDAVCESSNSSGTCVICLDAPVEGACIPCGHMAGCMSCLSKIEAKKLGCPVCRSSIDQVIKLYAV